ncbi:hypothetical protein AB4099_18580 [Bosea sp. 2KB_26]|uniref:hypothetical protein n=1 Tax=Bosea sp. 2KB_26 TaxID=3237475 RepID=UPI003F91E0E2
MIFSRAIAWACLTFLQGALAFVAGLLLLLIIVQQVRGDAGAQPLANLIAAAAGVAFACRFLARKFA